MKKVNSLRRFRGMMGRLCDELGIPPKRLVKASLATLERLRRRHGRGSRAGARGHAHAH